MSFIQSISGTSQEHNILLRSVIGFISPTGGTGVTTIATSVAYLLAKLGYSVCFIDTNIVFPMAYTYLVSTNSMSKQKHDLLEMGERDIGEIVISGRHENISLITCKSRKLIDQLSPRDSQQQMQVLIDECKKSFDFVILDISRDPTHISSAALISADMTYQVWDESPSCYTNCTHFISYLLEMGTFPSKVLRVVINKRTGVKLPSKLFSSNSLSLVSTIPYSQSILSSSWSGKVIGEIASTKKVMALASEGINLLVNNILGTDVLNKMEELRVEQKKVLGNKKGRKRLPKKSKKNGGRVDADKK